jgi:hypothetical protein
VQAIEKVSSAMQTAHQALSRPTGVEARGRPASGKFRAGTAVDDDE